MPKHLTRYSPYPTPGSSGHRISKYGMRFASQAAKMAARYAAKSARRILFPKTPSRTPSRSYNAIQRRSGVSTRTPARNKKNYRRKRKRTVKVSKQLSRKIKKVMESEEEHLTGTQIIVARPQIERTEADNKKTWFCYPFHKNSAGSNPGNQYGVIHSWRQLQYAANRLFGDEIAQEFPALSGSDESIDQKTGTIEVDYHKATYYIKNNSERTYRIGMFKCTAKKQMGNADVPMRRWFTSFQNEHVAPGVTDQGYVTGFSTPTDVDGYRQLQTEWAHSPRYYQQFREFFDVEELKMVLEPGQTITQVVRLPTGKFQGVDYYTDSVYQEHHKGSISIMFSIMPDIISAVGAAAIGTVGVPGYFKDVDGETGTAGADTVLEKGLIFECKVQRKIKMPETTGLKLRSGVVGDTLPTNLRRGPFYAYEDFTYPLPTDPFYLREDEQRPGVPVNQDKNLNT